MPKQVERFQFNTEFQEELLRFTVTDKKNGYRALLLYQDSYFALVEHQIIAKGLKDFYKKKRKVPSLVLLKETLRQLYLHRDFVDLILPADKKRITTLVDSLYATNAKDGDSILEETIKFAQYVKLKSTLEEIDVNNFSEYETINKKIKKALQIGTDLKREKGVFIVSDVAARMLRRQNQDPSFPTPFAQLNSAFDAGGTHHGNVIVVVGPEKKYKTAFLINTTLGYARLKKKVVYFDFENGEDSLSVRVDQSILNKNKKEILSGDFDLKLRKLFRRYKRLGVEIAVKRFPAYQATTIDLQHYLDQVYSEYGIRFDDCIIDFVGKMASVSGKKDDVERISDAYVDVQNFAEFNKFECLWTAHHTTREGNKREHSCYLSTDLAKCIDIGRHVDVSIGINQSEDEASQGVIRLEMIDQRLGPPNAKCLFWISMANQKITEFNKKEVEGYHKLLKEQEKENNGSSDI